MNKRNSEKNQNAAWWQTSTVVQAACLAAVFVTISVIGRFTIDLPNFKPALAIAILSGAILRDWKLALWIPLVAMAVTDLSLGSYHWALMASVYFCIGLPVFWHSAIWAPLTKGRLHKASRSQDAMTLMVGSNVAGIASALLFFVVTNFAVWATSPWYAGTAEGLFQCYGAGIPFLRWMLMGNLFFVNAIGVSWLAWSALVSVSKEDVNEVSQLAKSPT